MIKAAPTTHVKTHALVLRTAGTNCDRETCHALELAGAAVELLHVRELAAKPARLDECALLVLPGGFSYGDDVSAGRVFGLELRHVLAAELKSFADRGGLVLGICNGFQVLVEAGLLEAPSSAGRRDRAFTLCNNESSRFECRWVWIEAQECKCPWLVAGERMPVPVAHAEGRFTVKNPEALERLRDAGQIALRYVLADGSPADYPDSPSGSVDRIAGLCDPSGRVLGLMPHPERNVSPFHNPLWTRHSARSEGEGLSFYRRLVEAASHHAP